MIRSPRSTAVRPTPGRVKEALFSIVGDRIEGARVLDLFAGTGAVGFEALSRGASEATFVEIHAPTANAIRETALAFGVQSRTKVLCAPAERAAARLGGRFDFVYADPPYALPPPLLTFSNLRERGTIDAKTTLVYEHRVDAPSFEGPHFGTARSERYGEVVLQFVRVGDAGA